MANFRFQDMEIWKMAIEIADKLFDIVAGLEQKRLYRFAEQLRAAGMSMSNNTLKLAVLVQTKNSVSFLTLLADLPSKMQIS